MEQDDFDALLRKAHEHYGCEWSGRRYRRHAALCWFPTFGEVEEFDGTYDDDEADQTKLIRAALRKRPSLPPKGWGSAEEHVRENALPRMLEWAECDPRIVGRGETNNPLRAYESLNLSAQLHASVELPAARDWLAEESGITPDEVRSALPLLDRLGYLTPLRWPWEKDRKERGVVTRRTLIYWGEARKGSGRMPRPVRFGLREPRYDRLIEFGDAPVGSP